MTLQQLIFYFFSALLLGAATMVIVSRNAVRGVLFLVLGFFASAVLWMLLEAEFLSLVLIFVYVGAVMTLFLFVVMMLNIDLAPQQEGFVRYLPFGCLVMVLLSSLMLMVIGPKHVGVLPYVAPPLQGADYSNVQELGRVLYTRYALPFELAAVILLVAIISAIGLAFRGTQQRKAQNIQKQLLTRRDESVRLVNMKAEKP